MSDAQTPVPLDPLAAAKEESRRAEAAIQALQEEAREIASHALVAQLVSATTMAQTNEDPEMAIKFARLFMDASGISAKNKEQTNNLPTIIFNMNLGDDEPVLTLDVVTTEVDTSLLPEPSTFVASMAASINADVLATDA